MIVKERWLRTLLLTLAVVIALNLIQSAGVLDAKTADASKACVKSVKSSVKLAIKAVKQNASANVKQAKSSLKTLLKTIKSGTKSAIKTIKANKGSLSVYCQSGGKKCIKAFVGAL